MLATPEQDDRASAIVALAPGGARNPLPGIIPSALTFAWPRTVATLFIAAEQDRFIPLDRVRDVFVRAPIPKRMFILKEADHGYFADQIELGGPPPPATAQEFVRTLTLAHFDATLKRDARAEQFLSDCERGA